MNIIRVWEIHFQNEDIGATGKSLSHPQICSTRSPIHVLYHTRNRGSVFSVRTETLYPSGNFRMIRSLPEELQRSELEDCTCNRVVLRNDGTRAEHLAFGFKFDVKQERWAFHTKHLIAGRSHGCQISIERRDVTIFQQVGVRRVNSNKSQPRRRYFSPGFSLLRRTMKFKPPGFLYLD